MSWLTPLGRSEDVIARHLPLGPAWRAFRVAGKRANRMLKGLSGAYEAAWRFLSDLMDELDPYTSNNLLPEWETAVGLPDACLWQATSIADRRAQIIYRLSKRRWNSAQDWHDLAALFGLKIAITPGWYVQRPQLFEYRFPMGFDLYPKLGRFRVYVDIIEQDFAGFEYGATGTNAGVGFPIPFGETDQNVTAFMCLINRIRPANVVVIWNGFPTTDERVCARRTFDPTFDAPFC